MVTLKFDPKLREDNTFDISTEFRGIIVRFERGITAEIPLCSESGAVLGSFCINKRLDCWVVSPSVFVKDGGAWWAKASNYPAKFAPYEFLSLAQYPEHVNKYMESL